MSTVTVTDLEPGTSATSTAVNATMTSWNNATAAGSIGADNVRVEGVDRRTMSGAGHVVSTEEPGSNTIVESSSSTFTTNVSGNFIVVPCGATNMETADMTINSNHDVILHASVLVQGTAVASGAALPRVWFRLERSTDSGATWLEIAGTRRDFRLRDVGAPTSAAVIPAVVASPTWCVAPSVSNGTNRYRIGFQTENGGFTFSNGTIFVEILGA